MSNSQAAIVIVGAFTVLIASFGLTYSVYKYGSSAPTSETTQIIEEGVDHSGD